MDGSGTADLVVFDEDGAVVCLNASGNTFMPPQRLRGVPPLTSLVHAEPVDVGGRGTASIVWSDLTGLRVVALLERKPYLLTAARNNLGSETRISYAPSTRFYLADKRAGRPWRTRLATPVHVVDRVERFDHVTGRRYASTFTYHHGYFDGPEREFRGFGRVDARDTESFVHAGEPSLFETGHRVEDERLHVPPVLTRTWFHTGAFLGRGALSRQLADEYWRGDPHADAWELPDTVLPAGLSLFEAREAVRALAGTTLRVEVFAEDGTEDASNPYTVSERNATVRLEQPRADQRHAVVFVHEREGLTLHYERDAADPRIAHQLVLDVDEFGAVTRSAAVAYPRRTPAQPEQGEPSVTVSEVDVQHQAYGSDRHRLAVPIEERTFELRGVDPPSTRWTLQGLRDQLSAATSVAWDAPAIAGVVQLRQLTGARRLYYDDAAAGPLPRGDAGLRALPFEERRAAFTDAQREAVFGAEVTVEDLQSHGGYILEDEVWWARSGRLEFDTEVFYVPVRAHDAFENPPTGIDYDAGGLFVTRVVDPVRNTMLAEIDYRVAAPWRLVDPNGNVGEVTFDALGMVVATASVGKPELEEGDTLADPTTRIAYDVWSFFRGEGPVWARAERRETHGDPATRWSVAYAYSSGDEIVQEKVQAEPEEAGAPIRWVGTGRIVRNNKGDPIKQYEPFFSDTEAFEDEAAMVEQGVTPLLHYDPVGRVVRVDAPDGTFTRVEFDAWQTAQLDANDTVLESAWHAARTGPDAAVADRRAAGLAEAHADTPSVQHLDVLSRTVATVDHDVDEGGVAIFAVTRVELDIVGNTLRVIDARGNDAESRVFGMAGQPLQRDSVDAGRRRVLLDASGAPWLAFDDRAAPSASCTTRPAARPMRWCSRRRARPSLPCAPCTASRPTIPRIETCAAASATSTTLRVGRRTIDTTSMAISSHPPSSWPGNFAPRRIGRASRQGQPRRRSPASPRQTSKTSPSRSRAHMTRWVASSRTRPPTGP